LNTFYLGQYAEAEYLLQQGINIYGRWAKAAQGFFLHSLGDFVYAQAQGDCQQASWCRNLRISRELVIRSGRFWAMHLGAVTAAAGNCRARQIYQESLAIARTAIPDDGWVV
jgi:hypothetical protein